MSAFTVDVSGLKQLALDLKRADAEGSKLFLKAISTAGDVVAAEARSKANFSTRIPGSVKVRRRGLIVRVVAGGTAAPDAAPLDHRGLGGTFRHPVFGDRETWVSQPAKPFLENSAEEKVGEFGLLVEAAAVDAFVLAGWR